MSSGDIQSSHYVKCIMFDADDVLNIIVAVMVQIQGPLSASQRFLAIDCGGG